MADVTLGYLPTDGTLLNPDGVNGNLFDTSPSVSLYETANGLIDVGNFAPGFRVRPHHIRRGQVGDGGFSGSTVSRDYFQDTFGDVVTYKPIAGCCTTFYQEYDVSWAQFFASVFVTTWRQPGPLSNPAVPRVWSTPPEVIVRIFFDGVGIGHTLRTLPQTVEYSTPGLFPEVTVHTLEARTTRHFNLQHTKVANGATPHSQLGAGWHSFGLQVYVAVNTEGSDTSNANDAKQPSMNGNADLRPSAFYHAMHRARVYVRNCGYYALL